MFGRKIIAELAEIDENLIRSPLTPSQEASAIFRRKAIYQELHPTSPLATTSPPSQEPLSASHSLLFRGAVFRIDLSTTRKWQRADCSTKGTQG
jgi:hypothetical protein